MAAQQANSILSRSELVRAQQFRNTFDQRRSTLSRLFLRQVLGQCLQLLPARIEIAQHASGKPYVPAYPSLGFNLSHSDDLTVAAIDVEATIGIDLERITAFPEMLDVARQQLSPSEWAWFSSLNAAHQVEQFFVYWTAKEACRKADGRGLVRPLSELEVTFLGPGANGRLDLQAADSPAGQQWCCSSFRVQEQFQCSVATKKRPLSIAVRPWNIFTATPA